MLCVLAAGADVVAEGGDEDDDGLGTGDTDVSALAALTFGIMVIAGASSALAVGAY